MVGYGGSSAGSYLADPTSPIPSRADLMIYTEFSMLKLMLVMSDLQRGSCGFITDVVSLGLS